MAESQIGLIGLGVMGANIARNIAEKGFRTVVYNRTTKKMHRFIKEFGHEDLFGEESLEQFIQQLEKPRKIIIMVKAGKAVDAVIDQLLPLLDTGDILIDCGNSNYRDTKRRRDDIKEQGFHFVGCGVSGGEEGALHGPSLMPGGSKESWESLKPIWEKIAAKDFSGNPCVTHIGKGGAGHYVKMVHNGIEYAVMQMIAEAYDLLKRLYALDPIQISNVFEKYGKGRLKSYLFDITLPVLRKKDEDTGEFLIDQILDKAGQKGTGKWTAIDALDRGIGLSSLAEAVFARINSSHKDSRMDLSKSYPKPSPQPSINKDLFVQKLEVAVYGGMLSAYAQGFELIKQAALDNKWKINLSEIARIWQGGCIIRADILRFLTEVYKGGGKESPHLLTFSEIQNSINGVLPDWREVVNESIKAAIPTPSLTSALQYIDAATTAELPANMIQGLRDYFGAHGYERKDKKGDFHTEWEES